MLPDGTIQRELRPDEEVFRRDSMETAECLPVGDDHPPAMVTPETEPEYRKGLTGESARRDGNWLVNSVVVRDPDLVEKIERGKVFVSCGYECDFRPEKGTTPSGEKYDGIQENIRYNHLAFVEVPRAGTDARVRMDDVGYRIDWHDTKKDSKETDMPNLKQKLARALKENEALRARADARLDGNKAEEDPADEAEMDEESEDEEEDGEEDGKEDEKPAFLKKDSADIERLTARCDSLEAENKKLRQQLKARTDSADITARVKTRVKLITQATPVLRTDGEDDPDLTAMNDREIKLAVVKRLDGFDATKKSDDYLDARFDAAMERFAPDTGANETQPVGVRNDSGDPEAQAAARMREATANRWKTGKKEH